MNAEDLEAPSEGEIQVESNQKKEYSIDLKNMKKIRNKRLKMNCKTYKRLLLEEQNHLLKEEKILQNRLQKYFDLESELKQLLSNISYNVDDNKELNQKAHSKEEQYKITEFIVKLQNLDD